MKNINWTKTIMNNLGWTTTDSVPSHEAVDAAAKSFAEKYPKAAKEIEQSRLSLHDSIDHPAKF